MAVNQYEFVRAWGTMMGSSAAWITEEVCQALVDNAPKDATYRNIDGRWNTMRECENPSTVALLKEIAARK